VGPESIKRGKVDIFDRGGRRPGGFGVRIRAYTITLKLGVRVHLVGRGPRGEGRLESVRVVVIGGVGFLAGPSFMIGQKTEAPGSRRENIRGRPATVGMFGGAKSNQ